MNKSLEELGFTKVEFKGRGYSTRSSEPFVKLIKPKNKGAFSKIYINGAAGKQLNWNTEKTVKLDLYQVSNEGGTVFALKPATAGCLTAHKATTGSSFTICNLNACLEIRSKTHQEEFEAWVAGGILFFK